LKKCFYAKFCQKRTLAASGKVFNKQDYLATVTLVAKCIKEIRMLSEKPYLQFSGEIAGACTSHPRIRFQSYTLALLGGVKCKVLCPAQQRVFPAYTNGA